jgi:hypothetical protein
MRLGGLYDGLTILDLRLVDLDLNTEAVAKLVYDHFKLNFSLTEEQGLVKLRIWIDVHRWILFMELLKPG